MVGNFEKGVVVREQKEALFEEANTKSEEESKDNDVVENKQKLSSEVISSIYVRLATMSKGESYQVMI